jgi:hypothetical protein
MFVKFKSENRDARQQLLFLFDEFGSSKTFQVLESKNFIFILNLSIFEEYN